MFSLLQMSLFYYFLSSSCSSDVEMMEWPRASHNKLSIKVSPSLLMISRCSLFCHLLISPGPRRILSLIRGLMHGVTGLLPTCCTNTRAAGINQRFSSTSCTPPALTQTGTSCIYKHGNVLTSSSRDTSCRGSLQSARQWGVSLRCRVLLMGRIKTSGDRPDPEDVHRHSHHVHERLCCRSSLQPKTATFRELGSSQTQWGAQDPVGTSKIKPCLMNGVLA